MRFRLPASMTLLGIATFISSGAAYGQWLKYPTPGIPRLPDGKPNLAAPVPKTPDSKPDLSGIWQTTAGSYPLNIASDLKPGDTKPWADALYHQRLENFGIENPAAYRCLPEIGPAKAGSISAAIPIPRRCM